MKTDKFVLVIGMNGLGLMPTTPQKARILLKEKKAFVKRKTPFTIQLSYKTGSATQQTRLGIDTGSQNIGVGITDNQENVHSKSEYKLRSTMEKRQLIETRKTYRQGRRYRKVRYRKPGYKPHTKYIYVKCPVKRNGKMTHWMKSKNEYGTNRCEGWLPPSVQQKVNHHIQIIDRYLEALPINTKLTIEIGRFDMQQIKNPNISNEEYQQGRMYGYENMKAYVLHKYGYRCPVCGQKFGIERKDKTIVLPQMHHKHFKSKGATDNPDEYMPICDKCHNAAAHKNGGVLDAIRKAEAKNIRGMRDMTFMNIVAYRLMDYYKEASFTFGNITNADRKELKMGKSHANDAVTIALHSDILCGNVEINDTETTIYYKQVRKKKRSLHEATPRKGRKLPNREAKRNNKNTKEVVSKGKKYSLYDKVVYNEQNGWITGFTGTSAYVQTYDGEYLIPVGKNYKQISLSQLKTIQKNNNWILEIKRK